MVCAKGIGCKGGGVSSKPKGGKGRGGYKNALEIFFGPLITTI